MTEVHFDSGKQIFNSQSRVRVMIFVSQEIKFISQCGSKRRHQQTVKVEYATLGDSAYRLPAK